ncbi:hypothetical protein D4R87_02315 [bacterium]|nr:MAG: hypothetical protein D4R87_02315 [bacterium]
MVGCQNKIDPSSKGFAIIIVVILISVILIFAGGFALMSIMENQTTNSQTQATKAYYIAESGIQEAVWRLQNDPEWINNFETDPEWEETIERSDLFSTGGSYIVQVSNDDLGEANLSSLGKQPIRTDTQARRTVNSFVYKAVDDIEEDDGEEGDGGGGGDDGGEEVVVEIPDMDNTVLAVTNDLNFAGVVANITGNIYADNDVNIRLWSDVNVSRDVRAIGDITIDSNSTVSSAGMSAQNYPPIPDALESPYVGFDNVNDSLSIKARAQLLDQVYSSAEFDALLAGTTLSRSGAVYITGVVNIERGEGLIMNGALAADGSITVGNIWQWWDPCVSNDAQLTVNHVSGSPAGLFSKGNISFNTCVNNISINGIIYAGNDFNMYSLNNDFSLDGEIIAQDIQWSGIWQTISVVFNEDVANDTLRTGSGFAPLISFGHWEEE